MTAYMLKTVNADGSAYGGFVWPAEPGSWVQAPDWDPEPRRGGGLHGALWGEGDGSLFSWDDEALWLVCEIDEFAAVDLNGKIKVPACIVRYAGSRRDATAKIREWGARGAVIGSTLTGGDRSTLTGGYGSTLTGGDRSTLTGGYGSTLTGGNHSTLTGGNHSTLTGGERSTLTGLDDSTLTGGDHSTLTGGYGSTLTGGDRSTLTGGYGSTLTGGNDSTLTGGYGSTLTGGERSTLTGLDDSTLTGGDHSTLTGGYGSTLTGGDRSTLTWKIWNDERYRLHTVYVGENGIKADTPYRWVNGRAVEVSP